MGRRAEMTMWLVWPAFVLAIIVRSASPANAEAGVSLDLRAAPLPAALARVEQASGLHLAFSNDLVEDAEPVTLSAKDEPVDIILLNILRPRGLESIYTGETMAAIVSADSDMGKAKMGGRVLRTFLRLEAKLERAEQHGDEVRVPEWTDADDRALGELLIDFLASTRFSEPRRKGSLTLDLPRLLGAYDPDARIGACLVAGVGALENQLEMKDPGAATACALKMLNDPDPAVRAACMFLLSCLQEYRTDPRETEIESAMAAGVKDAAPEVRIAAGIMPVIDKRCDADLAFTAGLRTDAVAAVRLIAWIAWIARAPQSQDAPRELGVSIVAEKNPIAKTLGVLVACLAWEQQAGKIAGLAESLDLANEPWLKLSIDLFRRSNKPNRFEALAGLMVSGKRSHQMLAAATISAAVFTGFIDGEMHQKALSKIAACADSEFLWARFAGIMACGSCAGDVPEARVLKALTSADEIDRLAGLLACARRRSQTMPGAIRDALLALTKSPTYVESDLAVLALRDSMPDKDAAFLDEVKRNPGGRRARLLLENLCDTAEMRNTPEELRARRQRVLLDAVLKSKDATLQLAFVKSRCWSCSEPLLQALISDAEPETFFALIAERFFRSTLPGWESAAPIVVNRFEWLLEKAGPHSAEVKAFASFINELSGLMRKDDFRNRVVGLVDRMLTASMAPGAREESVAAGCELLASCFGYESHLMLDLEWKDVPAGIKSGAARALEFAGHKRLGHRVAELLELYHNRVSPESADPDFLAAMEKAWKKILDTGPVGDQVIVLEGMARSRNKAISGVAAADLQERLLEGSIPRDARRKALSAIPWTDGRDDNGQLRSGFSPEFKQYLLKAMIDPKEDVRFREDAGSKLAMLPQYHGELIPALTQLAKNKRDKFDVAPVLGNLSIGMRQSRRQMEAEPPPAWLEQAAALGLMVMNDEKRQAYQRESGMFVYALAVGADAAADLEAMALNEKLNDVLRSAASEAACLAHRETRVFVTLLERYARMKNDLRGQLALRASKVSGAPGAEAFVIRYIKDSEIHYARRKNVLYLELPATPALIAALKELENDPDLGVHVKRVIQRLEREKKQENVP